jgi:hypothetical protein
MTLAVSANVTFNLYRGSSSTTPYSFGAVVGTYQGYLKPEASSGRFGSAQWLKWTHELWLAPTVDIRDAYNSQLDPARDNTRGDTVVVTGSEGHLTAYYVVFVEQVARGTVAAYLRVYLDRFQPQSWPTDSL